MAEYVDPLPTKKPILTTFKFMGPQPSLAQRKEIWDVTYGDKPYTSVVAGPFELALPSYIDFRKLVLGEGNKVYDNLCRLMGPHLVLSWTIVDNKASSLIVGVNPIFNVGAESLFLHQNVRRLWFHVLQWLKVVKQGHNITIVDHLKDILAATISPAQADDFDV
ncbi:unnamed protein product [Fusarium fujikuroi]|nr:unnamed protein product [Fusarium fujikuroi]